MLREHSQSLPLLIWSMKARMMTRTKMEMKAGMVEFCCLQTSVLCRVDGSDDGRYDNNFCIRLHDGRL
jgi:hypothetical protein